MTETFTDHLDRYFPVVDLDRVHLAVPTAGWPCAA
jgi:hypothetical protein